MFTFAAEINEMGKMTESKNNSLRLNLRLQKTGGSGKVLC